MLALQLMVKHKMRKAKATHSDTTDNYGRSNCISMCGVMELAIFNVEGASILELQAPTPFDAPLIARYTSITVRLYL